MENRRSTCIEACEGSHRGKPARDASDGRIALAREGWEMVSQELVDLMQSIDDDALAQLDVATINAARAGGVLAVQFREELPRCDWYGCEKPASFDAHLAMGTWANMCGEHYRLHGSPALGLGRGQRLMLHSTEEQKEEDMYFEDIEDLKDIGFDGDVLDCL